MKLIIKYQLLSPLHLLNLLQLLTTQLLYLQALLQLEYVCLKLNKRTINDNLAMSVIDHEYFLQFILEFVLLFKSKFLIIIIKYLAKKAHETQTKVKYVTVLTGDKNKSAKS